jgi:dienelactone hydrolase
VARLANVSADLTFPSEASEISFFSRLQMAIYRPSGEGPFPAVVILRSCGGLRPEILEWARRTVARGYVAFVVDPVTQRGSQVCVPNSLSNHYRGAKDAFQALVHLKRFPLVDPERVALLGFCKGGRP